MRLDANDLRVRNRFEHRGRCICHECLMRAIFGCRSDDRKCLRVRYRFRARGRRGIVFRCRSLRSDRSLAATVTARLAVHVTFPAIASAATSVTSPAAAFAMLGVVRRTGLPLNNGRLRRVGCARFLRLLRLLRLGDALRIGT